MENVITHISLKTEDGVPEFTITSLDVDVRYYELFQVIKEKNPTKEKSNVVLYKLTGIPEGENPNSLYEDQNQIEKMLFDGSEVEKEINGKKVKSLEFEVYFVEKKKLKLYFFVPKTEVNEIYSEMISKFGNKFLHKNENRLYYHENLEYFYGEEKKTLVTGQDDFIVVITSGSLIKYVLDSINADSILIFTSPANVDSMKEQYLNETYPQVKCVNTKIEPLLKDEYFKEDN